MPKFKDPEPKDISSDWSPGICQCGCGQPTPIAQKTRTSQDQIKGQPLKYLKGHCSPQKRREACKKGWVTKRALPGPETGVEGAPLCKCGCGLLAPIAKQHRKERGIVKGQIMDYISGHNLRSRSLAPPEKVLPAPSEVTPPSEAKLCKCGCGLPAPVATQTRKERGIVRGQVMDYLPGHNFRQHAPVAPSTEPAYCQCGCGQPVPVAKRTRSDQGLVKGMPIRYLPGHYAKKAGKSKQETKPTEVNKNQGKSRLVILGEQARAEAAPEKNRCIDCGALFEKESRLGVPSSRCPVCREKVIEKTQKSEEQKCFWCGEEASAHSGNVLKKKLWACLKCWEKLKSAMRGSLIEKESTLSGNMDFMHRVGV